MNFIALSQTPCTYSMSHRGRVQVVAICSRRSTAPEQPIHRGPGRRNRNPVSPDRIQAETQIIVFMCSTWSCISFAAALIFSTDPSGDFQISTIFCS